MANAIHLVLVDPNPTLCAAWQTQFAEWPGIEIVNGYFEAVPTFDCLVSAANSFGLMDGGVDEAIIRYFGTDLMRRVQRHIVEEFLGEQPIGTAFLIDTGHPSHPFLAHTPTMRIPMAISRTDNVYTAMWAMLLAVRQHNRRCEQEGQEERSIQTVACPGLGTGIGRVPFDEAARQMALAYRHYLSPPDHITWKMASARQDAVGRGGDLGLIVARKSPASAE